MSLLAPHKLRPLQALAASLLFKHRRLLLVLPRQWGGKTELGCRVGVEYISVAESRSGLFVAKDRGSAKKATREKFDRLCPRAKFAVNTEQIYNKAHKTATLFISSVDKDPDRARGGTYGWLHWSEAAFSKIELGETIISVWQKIFAPTLSIPNGYALIETTLNGKNQFYELWENHKDFGFHRFLCGIGQMVDMGLLDVETYDQEKKNYHPDVWRQEFECEFVSFQGRVYPEFDEAIHVDPEIPWPESWQRMIFAVDWGFRPGATCVLFAYVKEGILYVYDEHYKHEELPIHTAEAIDARKREHGGLSAGVGDHDLARNHELTLRGIEVGLADKLNVMGARMTIKEALYFTRIKIHPRCKNLRRELLSATWHVRKEGELDETQDSIGHWDAEATLRYLIRMLSESEADEPEENPHDGVDAASARAHELWRSRRV